MSEDKITPPPQIDFKSRAHPLLASLPDHLKDHHNFEKIMRSILDTLASSCSHDEVLKWAECAKCTGKMLERRLLLRRLGFKNPAQFMAWRRVHEEIKKRTPLVNWKKV